MGDTLSWNGGWPAKLAACCSYRTRTHKVRQKLEDRPGGHFRCDEVPESPLRKDGRGQLQPNAMRCSFERSKMVFNRRACLTRRGSKLPYKDPGNRHGPRSNCSNGHAERLSPASALAAVAEVTVAPHPDFRERA